MARDKLSLPALKEWGRYAGGINSPKKDGYGIIRNHVQWSIEPVATMWGKHLGWRVWAFGLLGRQPGYVFFAPDGKELSSILANSVLHRTPASACRIARIAHEVYQRK